VNKKLLKLEIIGFVFVCIVGTLMHFLYDWTNKNTFVGLFCPVNESPWEHLKLIFFPYAGYAIFERIKLNKDKFDVYFAKYIGLLFGLWSTLSVYYTVSGSFGKMIDWVNISTFFIGVAIAFVTSYLLINSSIGNGLPNSIAGAMLIITAIVFFIFTFKPPMIALFQDPQSLKFGI
jgi:hypothetical protein